MFPALSLTPPLNPTTQLLLKSWANSASSNTCFDSLFSRTLLMRGPAPRKFRLL
jgi:hypothetical protein